MNSKYLFFTRLSQKVSLVNISLIIFVLFASNIKADTLSCYAYLKNDTLCIGNNRIERKFLWNNGNLITHCITDKQNRQEWINQHKVSDFYLPKQGKQAENGTWKSQTVETEIVSRHLEVVVEYQLDQLQIRRIYRLYPDCPAIACETCLKGKAYGSWQLQQKDFPDVKNKREVLNILTQQDEIPVIDQLSLEGRHWHLDAIEFFDVSDVHNTFMRPYSGLSYHENAYRGNILFFENLHMNKGLFFIKQAPCSGIQLAYPGADFITGFGRVKMIGTGLTVAEVNQNEWIRAYGAVTGVYAGGETEKLIALRSYQKNIRKQEPRRDEMILLNTWGDRGNTRRLTEAYCLKEIEACARMGITHFQIDAGWQKTPDMWIPDERLFPNGFAPLVQKGKDLGIEIGLWFVPASLKEYENWEKDADALIRLYKNDGIRTFKIDDVVLFTKLSEIRFRKMLDKVLAETNNAVVFNLDITAGRRGGYFYLDEYGNFFLENRYTDYVSYYPFWTLRNLWMLSKYVPPEKLQIEFLNKWRNQDKYGNDPFAPKNYSFDYLFATTMAAQPLVWMDLENLPEEAFATGNLIKQYGKIQHDFHQGVILPVGEEPSGKSWTGFQSLKGKEGYLLIYREQHPDITGKIKTYFKKDDIVEFIPVLGNGKRNRQKVAEHGTVSVSLPDENSFVLYKYIIKQ